MKEEYVGHIKYLTRCVCYLIYGWFTISSSLAQNSTLFNDDWQFTKDVDTTLYEDIIQGAETSVLWKDVSLPHTANIEPVIKTKPEWQGVCFYKKSVFIADQEKGNHIALQFDGAMHDATVYLNGRFISRHQGGYLPFYLNLSDKLQYGKTNDIVVRLDNRDNAAIPPGKPLSALDFNYYSGLYRNVYFINKNSLYISNPIASERVAGGGVLLHYDSVSNDVAFLDVQTDVKNDRHVSQKCKVKITLIDSEGKEVAKQISNQVAISANDFGRVKQRLKIKTPKLWSPDTPLLYTLKVQVWTNEKIVDEESVSTGIRKVVLKDNQLYLNGEKIILRGTNRHQEYPYIGNALSDNAQYRDAWKIKEAGFNFVRTAHYPHAPAFLDACDELGLLVMNAIPGWQFFGKDSFVKNSYRDIRDMVRRDRNHPSVIFWEASLNESGMTKGYMTEAHQIVKEELPYENTFTAGWKDFAYDIFIPARQHAKTPDYWKQYNRKPILISEYGDWEYYAHNAGFNQKAFKDLLEEERTSRQLRKHGSKRLLQQALNYQEAHNDNLSGKILGDANWLMFDYKRGYADDIESSGIMDIMRLPKFSYYFYQSQRHVDTSSVFHKPVLFIANYWKTSEDTLVKVFSNCHEVELYLDGKLIERRFPDTDRNCSNLAHPPFTFKIPTFKPGELTAFGYIHKKRVAETVVETYTTPNALRIDVDMSGRMPKAGVNDVLFVHVSVVDTKRNIVFDSTTHVNLKIEDGDAEIVGPTNVEAEAGIASFLLKVGKREGKITIVSNSSDLHSDSYVLETKY